MIALGLEVGYRDRQDSVRQIVIVRIGGTDR